MSDRGTVDSPGDVSQLRVARPYLCGELGGPVGGDPAGPGDGDIRNGDRVGRDVHRIGVGSPVRIGDGQRDGVLTGPIRDERRPNARLAGRTN